MKLTVFLPLLLAFVVFGTSAPARDTPPVVVTHVAAAKKSETSLRFSEAIRIFLPALPESGPGCEWQIMSNDARILRVSAVPKPATPADEAAAAEKSGAPVTPGGWVTTFFALRPGRSVVRLAYVRPTEPGETTAIATREINVVVN
ncbi:MAG: hypothetical protein NTV51_16025 [Verrucomicrobia bacterium]|nr:hypothetical protein [Verrucomicrobiota bacterium]